MKEKQDEKVLLCLASVTTTFPKKSAEVKGEGETAQAQFRACCSAGGQDAGNARGSLAR